MEEKTDDIICNIYYCAFDMAAHTQEAVYVYLACLNEQEL